MTVHPDPTTDHATDVRPAELTHLYDVPTHTARQFLLNVMHDKHTPLHIRVDAADKLLRIFGPHDFYPPTLKYLIEGIKLQ